MILQRLFLQSAIKEQEMLDNTVGMERIKDYEIPLKTKIIKVSVFCLTKKLYLHVSMAAVKVVNVFLSNWILTFCREAFIA